MAMTLLETIEVGSGGVAAVEFTDIPQDGLHLYILLSARSGLAQENNGMSVEINGSSANSNAARLLGYNTTVTGNVGGLGNNISQIAANSSNAGLFSSTVIVFSNYASSREKRYSSESAIPNSTISTYRPLTYIYNGVWEQTTAITTIKFASGTFMEHTTASIYIIS